jgi:micrococcal nuclease
MLKIGTGIGAIGIIFALIFFAHALTIQSGLVPAIISPKNKIQKNIQNTASDEVSVDRVVDGDTIVVRLQNNTLEKVRIIGMNAPESVDPRRKVECYGKEASVRLTELIQGKTVRLERDDSQQNYDKYGRLLRYVFLDGKNIAESMIADGYAYEYTYRIPYTYQKIFKIAQQEAQKNEAGLWQQGVCK